MSAKTKIVVLHMKELIYTVIFIILGCIFLLLMILLFTPKSEATSLPSSAKVQGRYHPGIYSAPLTVGGQNVNIEVIVTKDSVVSIELTNLSEATDSMYPLLRPTLEHLSEQICSTQSMEKLTYASENKYTALVLKEAIASAIDKALIEPVQTVPSNPQP